MPAFAPSTDTTAAVLIAGFALSTVGLSLFVYGKKQRRAPQMVGGLALMALPLCGVGAPALWLLGLGIVAGVVGAVRMGW